MSMEEDCAAVKHSYPSSLAHEGLLDEIETSQERLPINAANY